MAEGSFTEGVWHSARGGATDAVINPATVATIGRYRRATPPIEQKTNPGSRHPRLRRSGASFVDPGPLM